MTRWLHQAAARWVAEAHVLATALGVLGFVGSLTPSLLPRTALFQGVVTGVSTAAWYGLGALLAAVLGGLARWADLRVEMRREVRRGLRRTWAGLLAAILAAAPFVALSQQRSLARAFELPEPTVLRALSSGIVAVISLAVVVAIWWGLRWLYRRVLGRLHRLPSIVGSLLAGLTVVALVAGVAQYVVLGGLLRVVGGNEVVANAATPDGISQPRLRTLSGSPDSREPWGTLGYEGRNFVGSATTRQAIAETTGRRALDPIRVYAAARGDRTVEATTDAVLAELDRTDAWSRSHLIVFTTTGRGWVNRWSVGAAEYLTGGDVASVAIQHSNLPSALAVLDAPSSPREAGRALTEAVLERVASMPSGERPRVFVSGESLGAYGGNAAFASAADMLRRVDGAVWSGTPQFSDIYTEITESRQGGSTQVDPVIDNGRHVRFAGSPAELTADRYGRGLAEWQSPRVAYLQHRSDPVAWWSPRLLFEEPDWLREDRAGSSAEQMTWLPVITFWQVTADLAVAMRPPAGEGHRYRDELVPAWAGVLGQDPAADHSAVIEAIRGG